MKNDKYMKFLEEASGSVTNNLSSFSNPAKDIINWRGKNKSKLDTTIASSDLESIVDKIVGPNGRKKDKTQFAEDYDNFIGHDNLDDLLEDDHDFGCESLEENWGYDGLDGFEYESDELSDLVEADDSDSDGLDDLLESVGLDPDEYEDDDIDEDYDLNEANFEDDDDLDYTGNIAETVDPDEDDSDYDDDEYDDSDLSESAPISALEGDYSDINSLSNLIREMDELENELDASIEYDKYNYVEESDTITDAEVNALLSEMRGGGCGCKKKCNCSKSEDEDEDEDEDEGEYDDYEDEDYEDDEEDEDE